MANATDELVSVRSDGHISNGKQSQQQPLTTTSIAPSYMGRNRNQPPSFMRHGMHMNHSQQQQTTTPTNNGYGTATTRDITETKYHHHQIPHIITNESPDESILTPNETSAKPSTRHHHRGISNAASSTEM